MYLGIIIAHTREKGNLYQIIPNSTAFFNQLLYQLLYIYTIYKLCQFDSTTNYILSICSQLMSSEGVLCYIYILAIIN